jgi:RNA recognition motif-containing protein
MQVRLYIGNLSHTITEAELQTLFAKAGQVTGLALIRDHETGDSQGFAFIEMSTQVEAEQAISMFNGSTLSDREMRVKLTKFYEDHSSGFKQGNRGQNR